MCRECLVTPNLRVEVVQMVGRRDHCLALRLENCLQSVSQTGAAKRWRMKKSGFVKGGSFVGAAWVGGYDEDIESLATLKRTG